MTFDFDTVIDRRNSDSQKWRKYAGTDIIPLWVADMDFAAPPAVIDALHRRVDHRVFGYAKPLPSQVAAVIDYCWQRYQWRIEAEWIVWLPGLVPGLNVAAHAVGVPGDAVLCATPVYGPFLSAPKLAGRETIAVPLRPDRPGQGARWEMDWDALERAVTPRTRQFFLCHPHNPVGRAFARAELERLAAFCERHDLVVTSDEIHCDLVLDDVPHIPTGALSPAVAARTITLMAPSKTYNIAGLGCSFAIISTPALRAAFNRAMAGIVPDANLLGFIAAEAAMKHGEPWRRELIGYLRANRDYLFDFVSQNLPGVTMARCEATYLAWLDVSALQLESPVTFFEKHGVGLSDGTLFGAPPRRFLRLNFGCPRATLTEALTRMQRAIHARPQPSFPSSPAPIGGGGHHSP
ncbi:MAG: PatB family C-S lyase [Opitutaceae bacterium]|nr:PatB family C-S lyase [Opitutaceae bacterium]